MGKRNDSIDFVTLYDVLNEAGLTERQVSVCRLATFVSYVLIFSRSTCSLALFGAILVHEIYAPLAAKWISSFSLTTFTSLSMSFVEFGARRQLTLTKLLVGEYR